MLLATLVLPPVPACAEGPPLVTILEGSATVIRGTSRFDALQGLPMQPDDLLTTGADSFMRIEFDDGYCIDLGPATRVKLNHPGAILSGRPALYLLSGWIKLDVGAARQPPPGHFATPAFDASDITGSALARIGTGGDAMFVESGNARFLARRDPAQSAMALRPGDYAWIGTDGQTDLDTRPAKEFVAQMPGTFRDSIPSQLAKFRGRQVELPPPEEFTYADVEAWIDAEPGLRLQFAQIWRSKAQDPDFRRELTAKLSLHPEWGPILFPELYGRKRAPAGSAPAPDQATH